MGIATYWNDKTEYKYIRAFSHVNSPTVIELEDGRFELFGGQPICDSSQVDFLPEPYKSRAEAQLKGLTPVLTPIPLVTPSNTLPNTDSEEVNPTGSGTVCGVCGSGPYKGLGYTSHMWNKHELKVKAGGSDGGN